MEFAKNYGGMQLELEFDSVDDIQEEYKSFFMSVVKSLGPRASRTLEANDKLAKWQELAKESVKVTVVGMEGLCFVSLNFRSNHLSYFTNNVLGNLLRV